MLFVLLATIRCDTDKKYNYIPGPKNGYLFFLEVNLKSWGLVSMLLTGFSGHIRKHTEQIYQEGL
jgi:hypothetical protein